MQLTPMVQNRNTNFKGASSISKYSDDVQKVITQSIDSAFENVLLKTAEELGNKKQSRLAKYITDAEAYKAIKKHTDKVEEKITSGIAWTIGKTANTELSKKIVIGLSHFKKISARMADLASIAITFFYVNNTRKSKKIEEERKMPLMVNNIAITVVSSTMAALIDKGFVPDALFCFNDQLAIGAMRSLLVNGIRVPQQVSVMGFSESQSALVTVPALSSVAQPLEDIGKTAARLLLDKIENPDSKSVKKVLNASLNIRGSSDPDRNPLL